ncbi:MAG: hypothetical protein BGP10_07585 [Rhodanobacter sp. 68-29]|uniref:hypothetical protein n=1 Tax=Rhodanobacter sp. PCA2 TaxID=2006117 RepID=UPI00086C34FF|nr:hypothetical protein [Rhodanobacter sp. PCA2]MBA2079753.1 hypothetical protein [Rhodanobacter sp. PCA2]MBN8923716.1 hypothetical protein [Rhodanobacter sp.]ODU75594.1 MAG: hypothetical protein ABT17_02420 [Rhodanobacter sp. SCN 69-32]OJY56882.1 MAG: hypothetical protein BGP10_07585 [Rhodanobacter sp. 68-29]
MKHETLMLHGLFAACLLACTLVLGTMLTATPASLQASASARATHALATSSSPCVATQDAPCPLPRG